MFKRCILIYYRDENISEKTTSHIIVKINKADVEELKEILITISEFIPKIPELIKGILTAIYSEELGEK